MYNRTIALAGNPNVGKSTVFNCLTGLTQHTGNWPGKTVDIAQGMAVIGDTKFTVVDLPGSYSLLSHSTEEEIARDFICFGKPDVVVVVCDASCLERNMNLVLQVIEVHPKTLVCVNLMDEAKKKRITVDLNLLSTLLHTPVCGCTARSRQGIDSLLEKLSWLTNSDITTSDTLRISYSDKVESAIAMVEPAISDAAREAGLPSRWVALRLIEGDHSILDSLQRYSGINPLAVKDALRDAKKELSENGISEDILIDMIVKSIYRLSNQICAAAVRFENAEYNRRQLRIDRLLTSRKTGILCMLLLLALVFWITIVGANKPSDFLYSLFGRVEIWLTMGCQAIGFPDWLQGILIMGAYRVTAWVVAVMLPPMAIFFPLFTLLEDVGYLPRIAFNLDRSFQRCGACGKQALTMSLGFGCNACGVTGCRIIDSKRERLIAILTNNFVPCNGRFPLLMIIPMMFFITDGMHPALSAILPTLCLTGLILLGVAMTFFSSKLLSKTLLKGQPSSFTLELPPFRKPQIVSVIVRSMLDRTFFVLRRAVAVAFPAGALIWALSNITAGGDSLLLHMTRFLDPAGRFLGMDGVILSAFILGFPANEIVLPIALMAYVANGTLTDLPSIIELKAILTQNGWTMVTALCTILFSLMHWPCSTTCLTIRKETGSTGWTMVAFMLPTVMGVTICALVAMVLRALI